MDLPNFHYPKTFCWLFVFCFVPSKLVVTKLNRLADALITERHVTTMSAEKANDESPSIHTDGYYEELASQEELYLGTRRLAFPCPETSKRLYNVALCSEAL
jgi:hypothetical protein